MGRANSLGILVKIAFFWGAWCLGANSVEVPGSPEQKAVKPIPQHKLSLPWAKRDKEKFVSFGIGPTFASFDQTDLNDVRQTNITARVDVVRDLIPREWTLGANAYLSAIAFPHSTIAGEGMKLLGGDVYVGWELPMSGYAWPICLNAGFYGMTTFGTDTIGYGNIVGPQLFPSLRFLFRDGSTAMFHGKIAPIFSGISFLTMDNTFMSIGGKYYFRRFRSGFLKGLPLGVSLDATRLNLAMKRGSAVVMTYTLSLNLMIQ